MSKSKDIVPFPYPIPWARQISRLFLAVLCDFRVYGRENIPEDRQVIFVSNHLGYTDVPAIASQMTPLTWPAGFSAKKYIGTWLEPFFRIGSPVWVEQDAPDRQALMTALKLIRAGHNFAIAPEGHRSRTGQLMQAKEGTAFILARAKVPILPIGIVGTEKTFKSLRPKVSVIFGKPFSLPEAKTDDPLAEYTEQIMCAIAALLPESYHGFYRGNPLIEEMAAIVRP